MVQEVCDLWSKIVVPTQFTYHVLINPRRVMGSWGVNSFQNLYSNVLFNHHRPKLAYDLKLWKLLYKLTFISSQDSSIGTALAYGAWDCEFESRQVQCSPENWVCLKFPCTRNSLLIVSWKLIYSCSSPWLNSFSWYGLLWATVVSEHLKNVLRPCGIQSRGRSALKITCVFFVFVCIKLSKMCSILPYNMPICTPTLPLFVTLF